MKNMLIDTWKWMYSVLCAVISLLINENMTMIGSGGLFTGLVCGVSEICLCARVGPGPRACGGGSYV